MDAAPNSLDERALMTVYDRYAASVYSLVFRITRDQKTSQDLVHELFLRLYRRSSRIDSKKEGLGIWLLCTARKMAIEHMQSGSRKANPSWSPEDEPLADPCTTLDSRQRQVLELAYFNGASRKEIAALLGHPLETVNVLINSALLYFRRRWVGRTPSAG